MTTLRHLTCEFCSEIHDDRSRFHEYYSGILNNRVLLERDGFVLMPSMGQISPGSVMLLPRLHVERFADLDASDLVSAERFLTALCEASESPTIMFEHGARECSGGGCGIYHAHIHIVPLPSDVSAAHFTAHLEPQHSSLQDCWKSLALVDEYLLFCFGITQTWTRLIRPEDRRQFPSQYFRRLLAQVCGRPDAWDWRESAQPEPALIGAFELWANRPAARVSTSSC